MSKLDLISFAMQSAAGPVDDAHVKRYRVRQLNIRSDPQMPVLADGFELAQGSVTARVHPRALTVIAGASGPAIDRPPRAAPGSPVK